MKKERKIDTQKRAIKKVAKSGSQEIEKQVIAKRERGITLIALVVTIIIMLILAGVALNMALGDNGLIQMAKFSRNKYEEAATNESTAMQELEEAFPITAKDLTKDNYGDYVDYGLDLSGDEDYTNDWRIFYVGGEDDGAANGRIFLIAADYVPNTCPALIEAETEEHAKMTRGGICCSYWSTGSIPEYHCNDKHNVTLNSVKDQCSFPEIFMPSGSFCEEDNHYYCSSHVGSDGKSGNDNSRCASSLQCTGNWKPFKDKSGRGYCADYVIGGPTIEMWVSSWNQKHGDSDEADGGEGKTLYANGNNDDAEKSGYYVGETQDCTTDMCYVFGTEGYEDTLYFPHKSQSGLDLFDDKKTGVPEKDINENASCSGYWLSSPSANNPVTPGRQLIDIRCSGTIANYTYYGSIFGVRPIVCLKANVKLTKISGKDEKVVYEINM